MLFCNDSLTIVISFSILKSLGGNAGFPDMAYRCAGHGKDDVALTGNLTYTGMYIRTVLCCTDAEYHVM